MGAKKEVKNENLEPESEREKRWFKELVEGLRQQGVSGEIRFAGSNGDMANLISPLLQNKERYILFCGRLSEPGTSSYFISIPGGYESITPKGNESFVLRKPYDEIDEFVDSRYPGFSEAHRLETIVDREGNEIA